MREEWSAIGDQLQNLLAESLHLQLDRFIEHADALSGKRDAVSVAALLDPHELRIAGKALRYTLELATACGHRLPAAVTRSFKRMQDALGLWHDYVVLTDQLLKLTIAHRDAVTVISVLDLAKELMRRSHRQLEAFNRLWNQRGEALAVSIRHAFPLTQPVRPDLVSEPQTDPDPPDSQVTQAATPGPTPPVPGETSAA